ncbi:MAG: tetratricopeptide repeat protein [Candidatus Neomarinimicrobiota bacterium]
MFNFHEKNGHAVYWGIGILTLTLLILAGCENTSNSKIPITTSSEAAKEYYLEGLDLSDKIRGQEAIYFYLKALAEDPDFAIGYLQLAFAQTTAKGFLKYLGKAMALIDNVSPAERYWILAVQAGADVDPVAQLNYFQKIVDRHPQDERAHNLIGNLHFARQEYPEAIKHYQQSIEINPNFSQPYNQLGYSHRRTGDYDAAVEAFKKYIELIPDDPNPYDSYAELLLEFGKHEESIDYYNKALEVNPRFIISHTGIATNLILLGDHDKAREQLMTMMELAEDVGQRRQAHFALMISYIDEGDRENALKEIDEVIVLDAHRNDDANLAGDYSIKGHILLFTGEPEEALKLYEESYEIIISSDLSQEIKYNAKWALMGFAARVAIFQEKWDEAEKYIENYTKFAVKNNNPDQIRFAHEITGMLFLNTGKFELAITKFQNANLLNPINYYWIGEAYEKLGDNDNAQTNYRQAAYANTLNSMNYAYIRAQALAKIAP